MATSPERGNPTSIGWSIWILIGRISSSLVWLDNQFPPSKRKGREIGWKICYIPTPKEWMETHSLGGSQGKSGIVNLPPRHCQTRFLPFWIENDFIFHPKRGYQTFCLLATSTPFHGEMEEWNYLQQTRHTRGHCCRKFWYYIS